MTFLGLVSRKRPADIEWGQSSRAWKSRRILWDPPSNCSEEEENCLAEILLLIMQRHRDFEVTFYKVKAILRREISPTEMVAELVALEYLLRKSQIDDDCSSYQLELEKIVTSFLEQRKQEYLASGDYHKDTPSGCTHYLLNLFCELLIVGEEGISKGGVAAVRHLLGSSSVSCYLEHEHRDHILSVLNQLERDPTLFSLDWDLDPRLMKYCRIDRKMTEGSLLFSLDVKRWVMQMLLTDIFQFNGHSNRYAVHSCRSFISNFFISNSLGLFLQQLHFILETGVYKLGNKSIDLAVVMELFLIRDKELDVPIPLRGIPIFEDLRSLGFEIKEAASIRGAAFEPYLQAIICSYHRNLLRQLVLICIRFPRFNHTYEMAPLSNLWIKNRIRLEDIPLESPANCTYQRTPLSNQWIEDMIRLAVAHESPAVNRILRESLWGLDCEFGCVAHKLGKLSIGGYEVPFSGSDECLEKILKKPCLLLILDAENNTHIIFTIEQLLDHLNRLIRQTIALSYDLWPINKQAAFKNWMTRLHSLPDRDCGGLFLLTSEEGAPRFISKAPRIFWDLPLNCSQEEKNCLGELLQLINMQSLSDFSSIFEKVQDILDRKISPTEMMAELAAFEYLLRKSQIGDDCWSYQLELEKIVTSFLEQRKQEYLASGDYHKETPSGRTHYLLNLFCELLIVGEEGISKGGVAAIRHLLGPSSVSCYLQHEHRDHIQSVLNHLEVNSRFFLFRLNLHPRLMKYCKIDRKMTEGSPLSPLDVKRWVMQMLMTDIFQFEGEGNCYAVGVLKFAISNYLGLFLERLYSILETGFYRIGKGNKSIDLAVVMELFLIRNKELDVPIPLRGIPIFQDLRSLGFEIKEASSIRGAAFEPYLQAIICSYHRNLLQQLVLICMGLPGLNGAYKRRPVCHEWIQEMIQLAVHQEPVAVHMLRESLWGLECKLDYVAHKPDELLIGGCEVPFSGSDAYLKKILKEPCLLLIVDAENNTHIIFTIEQLLDHLNRLIRQTMALSYDLWPTSKQAAFKSWMTRLHSLPDEDCGSLFLLISNGGVLSCIIEDWGFPHESVYSAPGDEMYFHAVAAKVCKLPPFSRVLLCRRKHIFTATRREIFAQKNDGISQEGLVESSRSFKRGVFPTISTKAAVTSVLGQILQGLGINCLDSQLEQIKSELSEESDSLLEIWARRLRFILIKHSLAVPDPDDIERLLRKEFGLPKVHYIGDLNWINGRRRHIRLRLEAKSNPAASSPSRLIIVGELGGPREWTSPELNYDFFIIPRELRA